VIRVHDRLRSNDQIGTLKPLDRRLQPPAARKPSDGRDELGSSIRYQPSVDRSRRLRAWAAVDHHSYVSMDDEQTRRRITRRRSGTHPNGHEAHGSTTLQPELGARRCDR
jgi:hypothetical protein